MGCSQCCTCNKQNGKCLTTKKDVLGKIFKPTIIPDYSKYLPQKNTSSSSSTSYQQTASPASSSSSSLNWYKNSDLPFKKRRNIY